MYNVLCCLVFDIHISSTCVRHKLVAQSRFINPPSELHNFNKIPIFYEGIHLDSI